MKTKETHDELLRISNIIDQILEFVEVGHYAIGRFWFQFNSTLPTLCFGEGVWPTPENTTVEIKFYPNRLNTDSIDRIEIKKDFKVHTVMYYMQGAFQQNKREEWSTRYVFEIRNKASTIANLSCLEIEHEETRGKKGTAYVMYLSNYPHNLEWSIGKTGYGWEQTFPITLGNNDELVPAVKEFPVIASVNINEWVNNFLQRGQFLEFLEQLKQWKAAVPA